MQGCRANAEPPRSSGQRHNDVRQPPRRSPVQQHQSHSRWGPDLHAAGQQPLSPSPPRPLAHTSYVPPCDPRVHPVQPQQLPHLLGQQNGTPLPPPPLPPQQLEHSPVQQQQHQRHSRWSPGPQCVTTPPQPPSAQLPRSSSGNAPFSPAQEDEQRAEPPAQQQAQEAVPPSPQQRQQQQRLAAALQHADVAPSGAAPEVPAAGRLARTVEQAQQRDDAAGSPAPAPGASAPHSSVKTAPLESSSDCQAGSGSQGPARPCADPMSTCDTDEEDEEEGDADQMADSAAAAAQQGGGQQAMPPQVQELADSQPPQRPPGSLS